MGSGPRVMRVPRSVDGPRRGRVGGCPREGEPRDALLLLFSKTFAVVQQNPDALAFLALDMHGLEPAGTNRLDELRFPSRGSDA